MGDWEAVLRSAGCDEGVIRHCRAVTALALALAGDDPLFDRSLLEAGGMLHDIGRSLTHGIGHAQAGAVLCRALGVGEAIARIVERHTGAGLSADECVLLGLEPIDCIPVTPEERLVAYSDKRLRGDRIVSMVREMDRSLALSRRARRRMYRLGLEMDLLTG
ncbi:MAG TPA: HDIG domain-containing protein [Methanoregulaceae archaeon]|nr:HDIG domain-containing protein [Methanoregulaceae archaeon]HQJ87358.1 HDIG domain-containing protein [Methanoregulaceae archaeon]